MIEIVKKSYKFIHDIKYIHKSSHLDRVWTGVNDKCMEDDWLWPDFSDVDSSDLHWKPSR